MKIETLFQSFDNMAEERFWEKVDKTESCWLWKSSKTRDGYGQFGYKGKIKTAHRLSWFLTGKTIPEGYVIRHKCRNKHCVNPDHLETGTQAENNADRIRDGTSTRGTKHPSVKLYEDQVRQIRARASENQRELGEEFGVAQKTISNIILRKRWKWLND